MSHNTPGDFGAALRAARERRGVSLRQIANATNISMGALEALERNDIRKLPGGIFSRAFVRAYAAQVGLDPEETIRDFMAQFPSDTVTAGHPDSRQIEDNDAVESERTVAATVLRLALVSLPLAGALWYFGVVGRPDTPAPASPAAIGSPGAETVAEKPIGAPADQASPDGIPRATAGDGATESPAAVIAGPPRALTPQKPPPGEAAPDHLRVAISATGPSWVSITVDGQPVVDRQLAAGDRELVEVRRDLVLRSDDAGALELTINGAEARPLGKSGESITARLNLSNFKRYLTQP